MHSPRRMARLKGNRASIEACSLIGRAERPDTQGKHGHAQSSQHPSNVDHLLIAPDGATLLIHQRRASSARRLHQAVGPHSQGGTSAARHLSRRAFSAGQHGVASFGATLRNARHRPLHGTGPEHCSVITSVAPNGATAHSARNGASAIHNLKVHTTSRLPGATNARLGGRVEDDRRVAWRDRSDSGTHPHL